MMQEKYKLVLSESVGARDYDSNVSGGHLWLPAGTYWGEKVPNPHDISWPEWVIFSHGGKRVGRSEDSWRKDKHVKVTVQRKFPVVTLCGSTRYRKEFQDAFYRLEHEGKVVLTVACYKDDPCCKSPEDHSWLDQRHLQKIDLSDEIYVLNRNGYIGESTRREILYAESQGKPVRYLESPDGHLGSQPPGVEGPQRLSGESLAPAAGPGPQVDPGVPISGDMDGDEFGF
jgi:hypothetical protein